MKIHGTMFGLGAGSRLAPASHADLAIQSFCLHLIHCFSKTHDCDFFLNCFFSSLSLLTMQIRPRRIPMRT